MSEKFETRTTRISISPVGEPLFSECTTDISIEDEAAGEFVVVTQKSGRVDAGGQTIQIDPNEWPQLKAAIDVMVGNCRGEDPDTSGVKDKK